MSDAPDTEEPGFEHDVNELPAGKDNGSEDRLEETPEEAGEMAAGEKR